MWVIWNSTAEAYVAPAGSAKSFTKDVLRARRFPSKEAAEAECCGNETPRNLYEIFN